MARSSGLLKKPHPSTVLRTNGLETESDVYHSAHGESPSNHQSPRCDVIKTGVLDYSNTHCAYEH